jgi:hypothetical protein
MKGQAGQWRDEWAAVVAWSDWLQDIGQLAGHFETLGEREVSADCHIAGALHRGKCDGLRLALRYLGKAARR